MLQVKTVNWRKLRLEPGDIVVMKNEDVLLVGHINASGGKCDDCAIDFSDIKRG
jgi:hypothetical protein